MNAAKNGIIAEFITGYLQREIIKEFKVAGGTDAGLRDGTFGIAPGRLVKVTGGDTLVPATNLTDAEYILAQSDDTVRDMPEDYNYQENYSTLPNLVVKNSATLKTVAVYKIVNKDDIKLIYLGVPTVVTTGSVSGTTFTAGLTPFFFVPTGASSYDAKGTIPYEDANADLGLPAGNRITFKLANTDITAKTDLPTGDICKIYDADGTVRAYTKDAFETDGSVIVCHNVVAGEVVKIEIAWKAGVTTEYFIDLTKAQMEANA